ncbi:PREDICTED: UBA and UBX domain-containing protein At4g15410-like [Populus euphratica]|uniref:UBA and UBX domain-containing protein At4g15410-like n=1 Tax=Populus euphratica TaxID=75702 RepID=A0AAJ6XCF4_POPEU|nr:PREDICTED: UBA and UBX domain-containing protein At4g15410-like [Populus euphratica]
MEDNTRAAAPPPPQPPNFDLNDTNNTALVDAFCEITSSSKQEALFFLESHQWDLDSAVSTFLDNDSAPPLVTAIPPLPSHPVNSASPSPSPSPPQSHSPNYSPSQSPSRSRSPSPIPSRAPYRLRSRGKKPSANQTRGGVRTLADLNRTPNAGSDSDDDDDDEPQQYYTGGEKSGMLVQDPSKRYDVDGIFDQARHSGAVERPADYHRPSSSSRSFPGTGRLLSGDTMVSSAPQPPAAVNHAVTLWRNGFTVDDGPLRRFDDPANASFLESIKRSECPKELEPLDRGTQVHLDLMRREENYSEPEKPLVSFQGVGRALGSSSDATVPAASEPTVASLKAAPVPTPGLVLDSSSPTTSIQLRLADGTRMVSRFNLNHTIRDIRAFIEASRPGGASNYQLQTMGFPPKQLTDPDQTIEEAGIASSVVIQKF